MNEGVEELIEAVSIMAEGDIKNICTILSEEQARLFAIYVDIRLDEFDEDMH